MTLHEIEGKLFTDQIGHFHVMSNKGNDYVVVFYVYDKNSILYFPIKNRSKHEILRAYNKMYSYLHCWRFCSRMQKLDNKTSHNVEEFITENKATVKYTPADMHHTNAADWSN